MKGQQAMHSAQSQGGLHMRYMAGYMIVRERLSKYFKYFQVFSKYSGIVRILVQVRK
jgi:hypothetical protein